MLNISSDMNNIVLSVLVITFLTELCYQACSSCSKEWMKIAVLNACSYSKRNAHGRKNYLDITEQDINEQLEYLVGSNNEVIHTINPIENGSSSKNTYVSKYGHAGGETLADQQLDWEHMIDAETEKKFVVRRHILEMFKRCCTKVCSVNDMKGICA